MLLTSMSTRAACTRTGHSKEHPRNRLCRGIEPDAASCAVKIIFDILRLRASQPCPTVWARREKSSSPGVSFDDAAGLPGTGVAGVQGALIGPFGCVPFRDVTEVIWA